MASRIVSALRSGRALSSRPVARRSLHASSSVSRKKVAAAEQHEDEDFEQEADEDLFAASDAEPVSASSNVQNAERRQAALAQIKALYQLPRAERKSEQISPNVLATFVHATSSKEEAEGLKEALRMWRLSGQRVSEKAAEVIIGRCCNLEAPEVAVEIASDKVQYGLPTLSNQTLARLHQSLLEHSPTARLPPLPTGPVSPSLILLRLALIAEESKGAVSPTTKEELDRLVASTRSWKAKASTAETKWAEKSRQKLVGLGAEWKAAAESLSL